ncbi:hypothetical protein C8R46DRAFT_1186867 [Mycena filopes]|nr:hypothetical protein C8R46DRAFT_1186867 [Mycena filopes]
MPLCPGPPKSPTILTPLDADCVQSIKDNILFGYPFDEARYNEVIECYSRNPPRRPRPVRRALPRPHAGRQNRHPGHCARPARPRCPDDITHDAEAEEPPAALEDAIADLDADDDPEAAEKASKPRKLVKDEHRAVLSVGEKLWIKIWGSSSGQNHNNPMYSYQSFSSLNPEYPIDGSFNFGQVDSRAACWFDIQWPDAPLFYVGVYAAIGLATAFVSFCSVAAQYTGALRASRLLFRQLLVSVVRATFRTLIHKYVCLNETLKDRSQNCMRSCSRKVVGRLGSIIDGNPVCTLRRHLLTQFPPGYLEFWFGAFGCPLPYFSDLLSLHDTTPLGRMLSRFGLDMDKIDQDLAGSLQLPSPSSRIFRFSYHDHGVAFSAENRFLDNLHKRINTATKYRYIFWMTNCWLLLNFDCLGGVAVFITTLFSIGFLDNDAGLAGLAMSSALTFTNAVHWACRNWPWLEVDLNSVERGVEYHAGLAGLAISSALTFTNAVHWACRNWTWLEVDLNSVERVVEYLKLPQEPPAIIESHRPLGLRPVRPVSRTGAKTAVSSDGLTLGKNVDGERPESTRRDPSDANCPTDGSKPYRPPAYWPSSSKNDAFVRVEDLVVKYAPELPAVLQGISFTLKAGERVGLIRRTGSGKSTLAMSMLRFVRGLIVSGGYGADKGFLGGSSKWADCD